ncbi:hypothetical protein FQR65_LT04743 [Abscondita terminalis]|nr:hypothetical protein FQR65_LT04743 [Abscondita terminalis]
MKFAEHLSAHITPEWRKQYINYEEMKGLLYIAVEEAPSSESVEPEVLTRHFKNFDEQFFHYCDKELKKINTFYSEKLAEATRKFATLTSELQTTLDLITQKGKSRKDGERRVPVRKIQELKFAFSEFYLSLILLQNYQTLNFTGFRKILKKHDKLLVVDVGVKWRQENVETSHFYTNKDIDKLIHDTEATVTNELESGDRQKAMKRLRVPPLGEQQSPWTTFKVGLFSGSFIVLFITVILSAIFHEGTSENLKIAFRLYRGPLLIIEFLFLIGVNVYGWRSSGVNHVLIFELDPRNHLSEQHLMEMSAIFGVIWTLSLLSFLYSSSLNIPPYLNPLALTIIMIAFILNPFKVLRHEARFWFLRICVLEDFILRFIWALSLYVTEMQYVSSDLMTSILAPLEVFRRFVWNFFRLENEHLNNCGKFRAVRDISVAPLDSSDQIQIIRMMDEDDGVINRGRRKQFKKKEEKKILIFEDSLNNLESPKSSGSPISLIHI